MWSRWWSTIDVSNEFGGRFLVTGITALSLLFFILFVKRRGKGKSPSPPGPTGLPFVGYLPFLGSDLRYTFKDLANIYGPIFKVRLGTKDGIVITSPSLAKEVLRDKDVIFSNRDPTVAARTAICDESDVVFTNYGPELRKMKKIFVTEMLSNVNLDASYYLRKQKVKKMINDIYQRAGEVVDIGELGFLTVISSAMSMVWGDSVKGIDGKAINSEFRSVVDEYVILLGKPNISDYLPLLAMFDLQGIRRKMKLIIERFDKMFDLAIEDHNSGDCSSRKTFLGCLLQLTKQDDPATSLTLAQVKGILTDAIIGGVDTTATTIEWAMTEILRHPEIMKNAQEELTTTIGLDNTIEEGHLGDLKYLNAILKETLRMHPPVPFFVPHSPDRDTTIGGYTVRNSSQIYINTWAIHRDPELWEAPLEFRPERFFNDCEKLDFFGKQFQYLPFGSGRRMCTGITLAEKTTMFVLASLLHSFEWKLPNDAIDVDLSETFGIVVKKSKPFSTSHMINGVTPTLLLTVITSLIIISFIFSVKRRGKGNFPSPPGPTGLPFVGYLPFLGSDLRWTFKDLANIYGPIFKVRVGTKQVIVITSPLLAKEVLREKDVIFSNRDPSIAAKTAIFEASDIVFSNYGPELRKMKKLFVSQMLRNVSLEASYYQRKQKVKNMINTTYTRTGKLVDLGELAFLTVISIVMSMVWGDTMKGLDGNTFDTEFRSVVDDFMLLLGKPNISDYIPCLALFDLQGIRRKMKSVAERFEKLFDLAIEHHCSSKRNDEKDFLGCLLELTKVEDPATSLSMSQVKGILLDAIIGGVDTTATTIEWAMAEILKHPEIMKNVCETEAIEPG
ncbi:hypothetical protein KSS87_007342 [Heliosperma pusillum]|nr:hypothetical protein KSS87_007342 [Heliosperma pusillum]